MITNVAVPKTSPRVVYFQLISASLESVEEQLMVPGARQFLPWKTFKRSCAISSQNISTEIDSAEALLLAGQATINSNIADLSTQLATTETTILAQLTTINTKLDQLEAGQQEICDKIDALEVKIDSIIDILTDTCPAGATAYEGKCYTVSDMKVTYADAAAACVAAGATLATMTAANEVFLYNLAATTNSKRAWIGLTMASGSWAWEDGSLYGLFTDWDGAEPTDMSKQCADARASFNPPVWDDRPCTATTFYICQSDAT